MKFLGIKNSTYFEGKPYLALERFPHYRGPSELNKIHIDLGVFAIVSRVSTAKLNVDLLLKIGEHQGCNLKCYNTDSGFEPFTHTGTPCFEKAGTWLSIDDVFMCYKRGYVIRDHGTAYLLDDAGIIVGFFGFSHRGGAEFCVGDTLFDPTWAMPSSHPDYKKYKKKLDNSGMRKSIMDFVPFKERGYHKIGSLTEALQAAEAMSDYLS